MSVLSVKSMIMLDVRSKSKVRKTRSCGPYNGSKRAFKQEIAVYIVQNEAVVVVVELFKRGKFFLGHHVHTYILNTP